MKVISAFFILLAHAYARPEVGIERKYEVAHHDVQAQQLGHELDSAILPAAADPENQRKTGKEIRPYIEGGMIPVHLIYEPIEHETAAVVKEVSLDLFSGQRKREISRVTRSSDSKEEENEKNKDNSGELKEELVPPKALSPSYPQHIYDQTFGSEQGLRLEADDTPLPYSPDDVNRALGIEARGSSSSIKSPEPIFALPPLSLDPTRGKPSAANKIMNNLSNGPDNDLNRGIRRRIQHYQTLIGPIMNNPLNLGHAQRLMPTEYMYYGEPGPFSRGHQYASPAPFIVNNPSNAMWTAFTNIIEYDDVAPVNCAKEPVTVELSRRKRETSENNYDEYFVPDLGRSGEDQGPKIMRLKVRRGGVAIAGPGGIATAGSGGTAIVGPGGTAYTTRDGTAVVGPGGRVIEIPNNFVPTRVEPKSRDGSNYKVRYFPTGGRVLAVGPTVYYNPSQYPIQPIVERI